MTDERDHHNAYVESQSLKEFGHCMLGLLDLIKETIMKPAIFQRSIPEVDHLLLGSWQVFCFLFLVFGSVHVWCHHTKGGSSAWLGSPHGVPRSAGVGADERLLARQGENGHSRAFRLFDAVENGQQKNFKTIGVRFR